MFMAFCLKCLGLGIMLWDLGLGFSKLSLIGSISCLKY